MEIRIIFILKWQLPPRGHRTHEKKIQSEKFKKSDPRPSEKRKIKQKSASQKRVGHFSRISQIESRFYMLYAFPTRRTWDLPQFR
jgi:hypothetical protein